MYWAEALAAQSKDPELQVRFRDVAKQLSENEEKINAELLGIQKQPVDMGGYYYFDAVKVAEKMRPSPVLNRIIDGLN